MAEAVVIEMSERMLREVDSVAGRLGQTRGAYMHDLVARAVAYERAAVDAIELGLAQLDRGETVTQDEMERLAETYPLST